jgi:histidine ammonia-lyase
MTAAQAVEFLKPLKCGIGTNVAYRCIRKTIPPLTHDRILSKDIQKALRLVENGDVLRSVEKVVKLM